MKRITYIIATSLFFINLIGCKNETTATNNAPTDVTSQEDELIFISKEQWAENNYELIKSSEQDFSTKIQCNGLIDVPPQNKAVVNTSMGGYIKETHFLEGNAVKKGQQLLTIENPDFINIQEDYLTAQQQLDYLKLEFEREQILLADSITSQKKYLKAKSNYENMLTKYNSLHQQLLMINIDPKKVNVNNISSVINLYAPISGRISKVNIIKGSFVSPSTAIMEIVNNDHLHLELNVFEKDVVQIREKQTIEFKIPEVSDKTYQGDVHLIGSTIQENRTVKVHGHISEKEENNFISGMFIEASILTNLISKNALPESAVAEIDNHYMALSLQKQDERGYYFITKAINIEGEENGFVVIKDELDKNASFLKDGIFNLVGEGTPHNH